MNIAKDVLLKLNFENMVIQLKKFGTTLTSRPFGQEAFSAFKPSLQNITGDENVIVDFSDVNTFSPSWGDEFITPLMEIYMERFLIKKTNNPSVVETLALLEEIHGFSFSYID